MSSGRFRTRIQIQKKVPVQDTDGHPDSNWTTIKGGKVWAEVRPMSRTERQDAAQVQGELMLNVIIRYSRLVAGVDGSHRILIGSRVLAIKGPALNRWEKDIELEFICAEGVQDNG